MATDFSVRLAGIPQPAMMQCTLRRFVSRCDLESLTPPDYLFTSKYAGRYNPDGIRALYSSEDATTAGEEWERRARSIKSSLQQVLYSIEASVVVLDLGDAATLHALGLAQADLSAPWEFAPAPTVTQMLGESVNKQSVFSAIRFPSDAARIRGFIGFNFVIFPTTLATPKQVVIRNDKGIEIQRWP